jgi:hypothetical protein
MYISCVREELETENEFKLSTTDEKTIITTTDEKTIIIVTLSLSVSPSDNLE